ncbi:CobW family GTP-binding protein [Lichenibacterium dinghuense]|uniref:CobW family GTP-binding protein n=1 Tax=Lichenibacterium dinghuense TaxID=2895977 RepID=UPI001F413FD4|nr:GTP-binding protein [Lichenibacterium sp. 6Y81]
MTGPVPVGVLTGFLGAGKTTLLNRLLADPAFAGTAVIVNEFGEIGIDHLLVEAVDGDMLTLTTGCLCCAARGDLLAAVESLLARRETLGFARIVIETTGLADPGPVLNALLLGPVLAGTAASGGVLTLVSAVDGGAVLDRHDEARRQVAVADRILITKSDLAPHAIEGLSARLAGLNPAAPVADAREEPPRLALFEPGPVPRPPAAAGHHHHHAADARIRSAVLTGGTVDAAALGAFVAELQRRHGAALLRLKGLASLRQDPDQPAVIQAIGHLLHPASRLDRWPGGERGTRLVAILDGVAPAEVAALWDAFFGQPAIDRPDAAALAGHGGAGLFA